jgi:glycosyltransferase involved in cell wall biosynthesis
LAERGETVHVIGQRWKGAPNAREELCDGRLILHRISDTDLPDVGGAAESDRLRAELHGLKASAFRTQWFAWNAAYLAERLIAEEGVQIIEAQDWEAPLYYLLLRRAIGLAAPPYPPCITHLHSATAFIRHYNGGLSIPGAYVTMKRMEEFCVRSADALLCPSRYYAAQCMDYFDQPADRITVIPLPAGLTPALRRDPEVWAHGSICFVGRLEPRKGIIEWIKAATRVAESDREVTFDFVGKDNWKLLRTLTASIPPQLRPRFRFHGSKTRAEILTYLERARAAVVPSRWENFPNVCIEAMRTGLPVIATRLGGMVELIEDGRTGWLTPDTGVAGMVEGLTAALRRCLAASPEERAAMGAAASLAAAQICDNHDVVSAQLAFRAEVVRRGASRSLSLGHPPAGNRVRAASSPTATPVGTDGTGAALVVRADTLSAAERLLQSVRRQTLPAARVALVCRELPERPPSAENGLLLLHRPEVSGPDAWNEGFSALGPVEDGYWLFLDQDDELAPTFLERVGQIFSRRPEVGLVAPWTRRTEGTRRLDAPPPPELVHQMVRNDTPPASAFRAAALRTTRPFRSGLPREYDIWDVANAVLLEGWQAATLPEALAIRHQPPPSVGWPEATALRAIRAELLVPFAGTATRTAIDLVNEFVPLPGAPLKDPVSARQLLVTGVGKASRGARKALRLMRRGAGLKERPS